MGNTTTIPITIVDNWHCFLGSSFPEIFPSGTQYGWETIFREHSGLKFTIATRFEPNRNTSVELNPTGESFPDSKKQGIAMSRIVVNIDGKITRGGESKSFNLSQDTGIIEWAGKKHLFTFNNYDGESVRIDKIILYRIRCSITYYGSFASKSLANPMMYDMKPFFDNSKFSDVRLILKNECGEYEESLAHKIILASHSPVFTAMFGIKMCESRKNEVFIPDITVETMKKVLRYMYTGRCPDSNDPIVHWGVYTAAEKYGMDKVKILCERNFMKSLTIQHIVDTVDTLDLDAERQYGVMERNNFEFSSGGPKHFQIFSELMQQVFKHQKYAGDYIDLIKVALRYWYTGDSEEFFKTDVLWKIFAIMKEHNSRAGREFCEAKLLSQVNYENIVDMLDNADNYQSKAVYWRALEVAAVKRAEISERNDFKQLCRDKPKLGVEFLEFCRSR